MFPPDTTVVEGGAAGIDKSAALSARHYGHRLKEYPADWGKYGKAAGPIRNQQMLDENPDIDLVIAIHEDPTLGRGTKDMVSRSRLAKKPVSIFITEEK